MQQVSLRILHLEDSSEDVELQDEILRAEGFDVISMRVQTSFDFELELQSGQYDIVLADNSMPGFDGLSALSIVQRVAPDLSFVFVSGTIGEELAIEALKRGATDYVFKHRLNRLVPVIRRALKETEERRERRRAENALQLSEKRFRSLVEHAMGEVSILSAEGELLYESPSANPTLGYQPGEFMAHSLFQLMHPDDLERVYQQFEKLKSNPDLNSRSEFRLRHHDGSWRWIEAVGTNLLEDPAVNGIVVNYHDITERKLAETQARTLADIVEHSQDAILSVNLDGIVTSWNKAAERIYGYHAAEIVGKSDAIVIPPERPNELVGLIDQIKAGKSIEQFETERIRKDGTRFIASATLSPIRDERGEVVAVAAIVRDVTERQQAEEQIRYQALLLENVSDVIVSTDLNGMIRSWNKTAEKILKFKEEEVLGRWLEEVLKAEYTASSREEATAQLLEQGYWEGEMRICDREGRSYHVLASASLIKDSAGNPIGFLSINHDITERKQAEENLQISETRYRLATRATKDVIWEWDAETNQMLWAENVQLVFGYSPEEIGLEKWWNERIHPEDREQVLAKLDAAIAGEDIIWSDEYRVQRKDGFYAYINDRGYIERDASGKAVSMVGAISDITDRKQAEESLRIQLERLASLRAIDIAIASSTDLVMTFHIVLNQVIARLKVDAVSIYIYNAETNELELNSAQGFRSPQAQKKILRIGEGFAGQCALDRYIQDGHSLTKEEIVSIAPHLVEEDFTCYVTVPLISKGRMVGVLTVFERRHQQHNHDWLDFFSALAGQVTIALDNFRLFDGLQRSNIELEKRVAERTSELQRALRVKDEFLANMSHELRTPLNAIIGLSESLGEQTAGPLNQKQQKYLGTIHESGHHLLSLINDILDLAKIESGQLALERSTVDIHRIAQSSLRMVKQLAMSNNQELILDIDEQLDIMNADERRLRQMLVNLLSNAIKFTPERGRIGLEIRGNRSENLITFTVWDTGIGISEGDISRLFHPFVQLDSDLARKANGTGLGLALVVEMARLHGGGVNVESTLGQGSRFTITLPWESAGMPNLSERTKIPDKFHAIKPVDGDQQRTILLVEDTDHVIIVIKDYLEQAGFKVEVAHNGLEGIEQSKRIRPDLILMDIQMPDMDGLEATRQLRSDAQFSNTPIIALTALAMKGDRERCLAAGMDEYISKPVHLKSLVKMIQGFLFNDPDLKNP